MLPESLKRDVKEYWSKAAAQNRRLFNGPIYSIDSIGKESGGISICMCESDYAHFLYSANASDRDRLKGCGCRPVAVSALLLTSEFNADTRLSKVDYIDLLFQADTGLKKCSDFADTVP